eukprot:9777250-Alexandrium_andersonii.AAC.1
MGNAMHVNVIGAALFVPMMMFADIYDSVDSKESDMHKPNTKRTVPFGAIVQRSAKRLKRRESESSAAGP